LSQGKWEGNVPLPHRYTCDFRVIPGVPPPGPPAWLPDTVRQTKHPILPADAGRIPPDFAAPPIAS
jgi:hypothetical protein